MSDDFRDLTKKVDVISRQAAIDALDVLCQEHRYRIPGKRETYSQYNEAWQDALGRAENAIGNLPSVQPEIEERKEETAQNVPNCELISRKAAIEDAREAFKRNPTMAIRVMDLIKSMPSVEPERKRGRWIDTGSGQECSECHEIQYGYDSFRYFCAFCGADMRGEQNE